MADGSRRNADRYRKCRGVSVTSPARVLTGQMVDGLVGDIPVLLDLAIDGRSIGHDTGAFGDVLVHDRAQRVAVTCGT